MATRFFRFGIAALPAVALVCGVFAACTDETEPVIAAAPDATADTSQGSDSGGDPDGTVDEDGSSGDGGINDSSVEAEASLPPLCDTYPDDPADATVAEGPRTLYQLIAVRALLNASDSCEIGDHFTDIEGAPSQVGCFPKQLAALAGCKKGGAPINYAIQDDGNGPACIDPAGSVQIGFPVPGTGPYSNQDVDYFIGLVRQAAVSTGMPAASADRLKALLVANKALAADGGDGGLSSSTCP